MSCSVMGRLYSDRISKGSEEIQPVFEGYQLIGDSQFLRFSEKVLKESRKREKGLAYLGLCVSGQKTNELFDRIKSNFHPVYSRVILMIGTNDLLKNTNSVELRSSFHELITHLIGKKGVRELVILTIPPVPRLASSSEHWKTLKQYNEHILTFRDKNGIKVIDAYAKFIKSDDLSCSPLSLSSRSSLVSNSSSPSFRKSYTFPSFSSNFTSNFGKIRTNLRIIVGDETDRTILLNDSDSDDDSRDENDDDCGDISITTTPSGKRSSMEYPTPNPKRQTLASRLCNIAQDDHNDVMYYDDDPARSDLSEKINEQYFEKYFDSECTRQDLIHLNIKGLVLIEDLIREKLKIPRRRNSEKDWCNL
ncbi:uncharacterized protein LOC135836192 isoform X1 [Planococcus citri]|uniref:uncharacterized protein LOC135836192 isoform X1 n=1 Tax=Planococcus citri TaxID=170843 RepID=UPI0031F92BAD